MRYFMFGNGLGNLSVSFKVMVTVVMEIVVMMVMKMEMVEMVTVTKVVQEMEGETVQLTIVKGDDFYLGMIR